MTSLYSLYERYFFVYSIQESAVLEGKLRPHADRDGRPEKVILGGRSDVKLREKQKDFEQRDYQAQRVLNLYKTKMKIYLRFQILLDNDISSSRSASRDFYDLKFAADKAANIWILP